VEILLSKMKENEADTSDLSHFHSSTLLVSEILHPNHKVLKTDNNYITL
jgi:hypothetical protein